MWSGAGDLEAVRRIPSHVDESHDEAQADEKARSSCSTHDARDLKLLPRPSVPSHVGAILRRALHALANPARSETDMRDDGGVEAGRRRMAFIESRR